MLTVNSDERITIDECLEHPWVTQKALNPADSTDGLTGAIAQLDFSKRKMARERTLLSDLNDVKISKVIEVPDGKGAVKVWEKNANEKRVHNSQAKAEAAPASNGVAPKKEETPAAHRAADEFMEMGGKGDQPLFGYDGKSRYTVDDELAQRQKAGESGTL